MNSIDVVSRIGFIHKEPNENDSLLDVRDNHTGLIHCVSYASVWTSIPGEILHKGQAVELIFTSDSGKLLGIRTDVKNTLPSEPKITIRPKGTEAIPLWEILVPTVRNDGRPIRTRFHRVWDAKVRALTGGLTVMPVAKGQWVSPDKKLFKERMIPVRIRATREQIMVVVKMTKTYYEQMAVLAYKVSDETILYEGEK